MTHEEKIEVLRKSPDYSRPVIGGVEREFCLGPYGLRLAKDRGVDVLGPDLDGFDGFVGQLWAGMLPFDPDLTMEDVGDVLSLRDMKRLRPLVLMTDDEAEGKPETPPEAARRNGKAEASPAETASA